jgi:hypothetical protein
MTNNASHNPERFVPVSGLLPFFLDLSVFAVALSRWFFQFSPLRLCRCRAESAGAGRRYDANPSCVVWFLPTWSILFAVRPATHARCRGSPSMRALERSL